ncbi:Glycolipid transfer protein domain containing protein [Parasponia andersonii]|uniref:Glycolipid transfer protein domain containing protein n=1 Tax=Parasponia andersonii TaxID=3476 RepID=A0A2P5DSM1_PARAD|nr:Glycolipid transfer protein domain containing protein [Parasponia andersonii]
MKRKRELLEIKESEIRSAIEELTVLVKLKPNDHINLGSGDAKIPTMPFLSICNLVLQVLDKIGPTMTVLRKDIHQNIQRMEKVLESDPSLYSNVVEMLKKEEAEGNSKLRTSCSRAFVWLTRSLDFTVALLQNLTKDLGQNMEQAVEESYNTTLRSWHGWISSSAYKVALKLVPEKKTFISLLLAKHENYDTLKDEIETLISLLVPFLEEVHSVLVLYRLDRIKCP